MSKVKIGFVGVGGMGQCAHLRNYVTIPDCEVVAIAELRSNTARQVAARYNIPRVYATHEEMLANEQLDAIVASQPFTRHGLLVPELLKAKVPLLTEKALAGSVEQGEKIVKALEQSGTVYMVAYHKRSDPAVMYGKAEIERLKQSGELGAMKYVRITMPAGDWVANGFHELINGDDAPPTLEFEPKAADMDDETYQANLGFVNYYIHQVNMMRHLLGEPYTLTFVSSSQVMLAVESVSGIAGVIEMSPYQSTIDWNESLLVAFEHGYVKIDLPAPLASNRPGRVEIFHDPGEGVTPQTIVPTLPWVHAMRQQAINFIQVVKGATPPCDAREALDDLRIAREFIRMTRGV